jgi:hypothetical protein
MTYVKFLSFLGEEKIKYKDSACFYKTCSGFSSLLVVDIIL